MAQIASQPYAVGTYVLDDIKNIPSSRDGIRITLTRESWPVGQVCKLSALGKVNGVESGGVFATFDGGVIHQKDGSVLTASILDWQWPGIAGPGGGRQKVRITDVVVTMQVLQPITTAVTTDVFTLT
jgi:hypothetical protein